jgi:hypothetical protein
MNIFCSCKFILEVIEKIFNSFSKKFVDYGSAVDPNPNADPYALDSVLHKETDPCGSRSAALRYIPIS